jgi:glyoxylase-like metal-dependent hydrolase (beta-lactamase superfamily II)
MTRSLRDVVLPLADDVLVLPGHGPATTMERERAANPYLQGLGA